MNGKIELQKQAFDAWTIYFKNDDKSQSKINGQLSCFCNNQYELNGFVASQMFYTKGGIGGSL